MTTELVRTQHADGSITYVATRQAKGLIPKDVVGDRDAESRIRRDVLDAVMRDPRRFEPGQTVTTPLGEGQVWAVSDKSVTVRVGTSEQIFSQAQVQPHLTYTEAST